MNGKFPNARNAASAAGLGNALAVLVSWVLHARWGIDMDATTVVSLGVVLSAPFGHLAYLPPDNGK